MDDLQEFSHIAVSTAYQEQWNEICPLTESCLYVGGQRRMVSLFQSNNIDNSLVQQESASGCKTCNKGPVAGSQTLDIAVISYTPWQWGCWGYLHSDSCSVVNRECLHAGIILLPGSSQKPNLTQTGLLLEKEEQTRLLWMIVCCSQAIWWYHPSCK